MEKRYFIHRELIATRYIIDNSIYDISEGTNTIMSTYNCIQKTLIPCCDIHYDLIIDHLNKMEYNASEQIFEDICNTTFYTTGLKNWNITNLLRKYNITTEQLYNVLNTSNHLFIKSIMSKYIKVQNSFIPFNINDNLTPVEINILDLDSQTYGKIINLVFEHIDKRQAYNKWKDEMVSVNPYINNIYNFIF